MLPHLVLIAGMTSVLLLAWRADHPGIEDESRPLKSTTQQQAMPDIPGLRLRVRKRSVGKAFEASAYSAEPAR